MLPGRAGTGAEQAGVIGELMLSVLMQGAGPSPAAPLTWLHCP